MPSLSVELTESEIRALEDLKKAASADGSIFRDYYCCADLALDWIEQYPGADTTTEAQRAFFSQLLTSYGALDAIVNLFYRINLLAKADRRFFSVEDLLEVFRTDVYTFHILFGALLDSTCNIVKGLSSEPELVPSGSFGELRKWCIDDTARSSELISEDLCSRIIAADWFPIISDLIHELRQSQSIVCIGINDPPSEFYFYTMRNWNYKECAVPEQLKVGGLTFFRPHVGYFLGRTMFLLNEICLTAVANLGISYIDSRFSRPYLSEIRKCIDCAISALEAGKLDMTLLL